MCLGQPGAETIEFTENYDNDEVMRTIQALRSVKVENTPGTRSRTAG